MYELNNFIVKNNPLLGINFIASRIDGPKPIINLIHDVKQRNSFYPKFISSL